MKKILFSNSISPTLDLRIYSGNDHKVIELSRWDGKTAEITLTREEVIALAQALMDDSILEQLEMNFLKH